MNPQMTQISQRKNAFEDCQRLGPFAVILSETKNPRILLRVNAVKHPCICNG